MPTAINPIAAVRYGKRIEDGLPAGCAQITALIADLGFRMLGCRKDVNDTGCRRRTTSELTSETGGRPSGGYVVDDVGTNKKPPKTRDCPPSFPEAG